MTRSKIQKMKFFIFLLIFLLGQTAICDGHFREKKDTPESTFANKTVTVNAAGAQVLTTQQKNVQQNTVLPGGVTKIQNDNKTQDNTTSKPIDNTNKTMHTSKYPGEGHMPSFNPGAIRRGFYVFVGLTIVVMAYIVFRSFRLNKTRAQMVRKYGVLTHRQDVEMRPLPLEEEDDEDTTIFDASNVLTNNVQHQNL